jgi:hypothetical protein
VCSLSVLSLSIAAAHAAETVVLDTPRLQSIDNFRDVAGLTTAYSTAHDGTMRGGVFYRSNAITPSAADLATLNSLGIKAVYDLRTPSEIAGTPDTMLSGASYQNIDIIGSTTSGANITTVSFKSAADAIAMMEQTNRAFVSDAGMRGQFGKLFNELASTDGAQLFHCTAGKDRTGWTAAVAEHRRRRQRDHHGQLPGNQRLHRRASPRPSRRCRRAWPRSMRRCLACRPATCRPVLMKSPPNTAAWTTTSSKVLACRRKPSTCCAANWSSTTACRAGRIGRQRRCRCRIAASIAEHNLSGTYSAYNYYLQSAIDAGTLGGVEAQVGGQVHADAASYLLRQNALIEQAAAPYASGRSESRAIPVVDHRARRLPRHRRLVPRRKQQRTQPGLMVGITQRFSEQLSARGGFGYSKGTVGGAGGEADTDFTFFNLGARYGFTSLERGLFVDANASAGYVDYASKRELGGGLGTAKGDTHGNLTGATLALGYRAPVNGMILEPSLGVRISHLDLKGFKEQGSELALDVDDNTATRRSAVANLNVAFAPVAMGAGNWCQAYKSATNARWATTTSTARATAGPRHRTTRRLRQPRPVQRRRQPDGQPRRGQRRRRSRCQRRW